MASIRRGMARAAVHGSLLMIVLAQDAGLSFAQLATGPGAAPATMRPQPEVSSALGLTSPFAPGLPAVNGPAPRVDLEPPRVPDSEAPAFRLPPLPPDPAAPLSPGQVIQPIDLATALRLAGARDLDIAIARERMCEAIAELELARSVWLPSLFVGPNWIRHDGTAQVVEGPVRQISKSSLFVGGTLAGGNGVTGPIPAGGPAPIGNLTTILRISDAIFLPLAARQVVDAQRAGVEASVNDSLLRISLTYFDLQQAAGRLVIAQEAARYAQTLAELTGSFARTGAGLEADHRRSLVELELRQCEVAVEVGQLEIASAEIVRLVRLDPRIVVAPIEPPEALVQLVSDTYPLDDLVVVGLRNRPELAQAQAMVDATLIRLKQARLRPLIPSLAFRYSAGGFGGGPNASWGNFSGRHDADVNLFWELQGLGLADRAIARTRAAQNRAAGLEMLQLQDRVAAEVVQAAKASLAASRQLAYASQAIPEAISSIELNFKNIRQGARPSEATRPIEVLQPIQALAWARTQYLDSALAYNRAQFQLYHALGNRPVPGQVFTAAPVASVSGTTEPTEALQPATAAVPLSPR